MIVFIEGSPVQICNTICVIIEVLNTLESFLDCVLNTPPPQKKIRERERNRQTDRRLEGQTGGRTTDKQTERQTRETWKKEVEMPLLNS